MWSEKNWSKYSPRKIKTFFFQIFQFSTVKLLHPHATPTEKMPLLMITGLPSAGKTRIAERLVSELQAKINEEDSKYSHMKIELVNDERLGIAKETYREAKSEKSTRGLQMSAVKRFLSKETIVILDNLTYIKGFRYQLFCEAKALLTNSCVLEVGAPVEKCREWNNEREDGWAPDLFDALVFRYEEPNGMSRWDSPLYTTAYDDTELPVAEIWESLVLNKPKPPNQATVLKSATPKNYLFELDKITQEIVSSVLELQKVNPGGLVKVKDDAPKVQLPYKPLPLPQLQRIRRTYIALNKMKTVETSRIAFMFIDFLNKNFERE